MLLASGRGVTACRPTRESVSDSDEGSDASIKRLVSSANGTCRNNYAQAGRSAGASGLAALLSGCMLHPLDLIRTRKQVSAISGGAIPKYRSTISAARHIWKNEGFSGLWKGVGVTATASAVSWAAFRTLFDIIRVEIPHWEETFLAWKISSTAYLRSGVWLHSVGWGLHTQHDIGCKDCILGTDHTDHSAPVAWTESTLVNDTVVSVYGGTVVVRYLQLQLSGLLAGVVVTLLTHPLWLVKARMEMQAHEAKNAGWPYFRNGFACFNETVRSGIRECYKGIGPALALSPHAAIQIAIYEGLKRRSNMDASSSLKAGFPFLWGAWSKFAAITATYPLQVLRSRQQVYCSPYSGISFAAIAKRMIREEGLLSLFGGYFVHAQRACLQSGLTFLLYETFLSLNSEIGGLEKP